MPEAETVEYTGKHLRFIRASNGWEYVKRGRGASGVTIVAVSEEGKILLVEQIRTPLGRPVIELPAGLVDPAEDETAAVRRELLEETGYACTEVKFLGRGTTSPGLTDELNGIYSATGLRRVDSASRDILLQGGVARHLNSQGVVEEGERISVYEVPLTFVRQWLDLQIAVGKLIDLRVFAGLFLVTG